jgi:hypothetical protein
VVKRFITFAERIIYFVRSVKVCSLVLIFIKKKEREMKKILWFSRHKPMEFQVPILRKVFGEDMVLEQRVGNDAYMSAEKIVQFMKDNHFNEIIMVAPLSVMAKVIELGVKPIKADVTEVKDVRDSTFTFSGRHYKFNKFVRVMRLELVTEDL